MNFTRLLQCILRICKLVISFSHWNPCTIPYAIFVSSLYDLCELNMYADDNLAAKWNKSLVELNDDLQSFLEIITIWLRDSGIKIN